MYHYNVNWLEEHKGMYYRRMMQFNDISHPGNDRCEVAIQNAQELVAAGKTNVEVVQLIHGIRSNGIKVWPIEQLRQTKD